MEQGPVLVITFNSQQVMCVKDKQGKVVEGSEDKVSLTRYITTNELRCAGTEDCLRVGAMQGPDGAGPQGRLEAAGPQCQQSGAVHLRGGRGCIVQH